MVNLTYVYPRMKGFKAICWAGVAPWRRGSLLPPIIAIITTRALLLHLIGLCITCDVPLALIPQTFQVLCQINGPPISLFQQPQLKHTAIRKLAEDYYL